MVFYFHSLTVLSAGVGFNTEVGLTQGITMKRMVATIVVALVALFITPGAQAQHAHHQQTVASETCNIGDYLCGHDYFHPIYKLLELITGKSCCHNQEGRPTHDIEEATSEQRAQGFAYNVWIDGQWCGAEESALMRISESQKTEFMSYKKKNHELFYAFFEFDHAFAPKSQVVDGKKMCSKIYCIYKKKDSQ